MPLEPSPITTAAQLGALIRQRRKSQKLTIAQCAAFAGVGGRFVSEVERGKPTAELDKVLLLCHGLGIRLTAA